MIINVCLIIAIATFSADVPNFHFGSQDTYSPERVESNLTIRLQLLKRGVDNQLAELQGYGFLSAEIKRKQILPASVTKPRKLQKKDPWMFDDSQREGLFNEAVNLGCEPIGSIPTKKKMPKAGRIRKKFTTIKAKIDKLFKDAWGNPGVAAGPLRQSQPKGYDIKAVAIFDERDKSNIDILRHCVLTKVEGTLRLTKADKENTYFDSWTIRDSKQNILLIGPTRTFYENITSNKYPYTGYFVGVDNFEFALVLEATPKIDDIVEQIHEAIEMNINLYELLKDINHENPPEYADTDISATQLLRKAESIISRDHKTDTDRYIALQEIKDLFIDSVNPDKHIPIKWVGTLSDYFGEDSTTKRKHRKKALGYLSIKSKLRVDTTSWQKKITKLKREGTRDDDGNYTGGGIRPANKADIDHLKKFKPKAEAHSMRFAPSGTPFERVARRGGIHLDKKVVIVGYVKEISLNTFKEKGGISFVIVPMLKTRQMILPGT